MVSVATVGDGAISKTQDIASAAKNPAASVLFASGQRPRVDAIEAFGASSHAFSISIAPIDRGETDSGLELVANGLTYEVRGILPGPPHNPAPVLHRIDLNADFSEAGLEAITLHPGPHLAGGGTMLPVVRGLALLTARLAALPGSVAVAWHPARCLSHAAPFSESITRWNEGGPFPGLGLTALAVEHDGALRSEGLGLFVGQELRIEPELAVDRDAAARLALSLLHHLIAHGPLENTESFSAPDGSAVRIEPSANKRFVRAWQAR